MDENLLRWDRKPGHYEVWYATLSHRASKTGFWIRYVLEAPALGHGEGWAELWLARFDGEHPENTFGIHKRFPITELTAAGPPFSIKIGAAEMTDGSMRGGFEGGGHQVAWDLSWTPAERAYLHYPALAYKGRLMSQKVLAPNVDAHASGTITVDGERYVLDGDPLGQSHTWGRKHSYSWAWGHCNALPGGAVIEAAAGRVKRGAIILPMMAVFTVFLEGEELAFKDLFTLPLARADYKTGRFHIAGIRHDARVEATFTCRPEDMVLAEYTDPDGDPVFCHNTCAADVEILVARRGPLSARFKEAARLRADKLAHFEWAARAGDALNVKKTHLLVS